MDRVKLLRKIGRELDEIEYGLACKDMGPNEEDDALRRRDRLETLAEKLNQPSARSSAGNRRRTLHDTRATAYTVANL